MQLPVQLTDTKLISLIGGDPVDPSLQPAHVELDRLEPLPLLLLLLLLA